MLSLDYYIFPMKNVLRELSKSSSQVVKGQGNCQNLCVHKHCRVECYDIHIESRSARSMCVCGQWTIECGGEDQ